MDMENGWPNHMNYVHYTLAGMSTDLCFLFSHNHTLRLLFHIIIINHRAFVCDEKKLLVGTASVLVHHYIVGARHAPHTLRWPKKAKKKQRKYEVNKQMNDTEWNMERSIIIIRMVRMESNRIASYFMGVMSAQLSWPLLCGSFFSFSSIHPARTSLTNTETYTSASDGHLRQSHIFYYNDLVLY